MHAPTQMLSLPLLKAGAVTGVLAAATAAQAHVGPLWERHERLSCERTAQWACNVQDGSCRARSVRGALIVDFEQQQLRYPPGTVIATEPIVTRHSRYYPGTTGPEQRYDTVQAAGGLLQFDPYATDERRIAAVQTANRFPEIVVTRLSCRPA